MTAIATIARGDGSRITDRRRIVVRAPDAWGSLWAAHAGAASAPPEIDFATTIVAGAFAGQQPTGGYAIEIVGAVEEEGGTRLMIDERRPAAGADGSNPASGPSAPTTPFHLVSLPRVDGEIRWTDVARQPAPVPADPASRVARAAHSRKTATGLRPRTGALLSYLAGPASGVVMLVAEPVQPFVRFHAWQSIIALGALATAVAACYALAFASLFFSANGISLMVRMATFVWAGLLVVWGACLWQAWKGRAWKLPLAGEWAERLATQQTPAGSGQPPAASSTEGRPSS
jgi:uncharacterized membrane protein